MVPKNIMDGEYSYQCNTHPVGFAQEYSPVLSSMFWHAFFQSEMEDSPRNRTGVGLSAGEKHTLNCRNIVKNKHLEICNVMRLLSDRCHCVTATDCKNTFGV